MPLQGALNAIVYGWSLPSIRDVYRVMVRLHPDEHAPSLLLARLARSSVALFPTSFASLAVSCRAPATMHDCGWYRGDRAALRCVAPRCAAPHYAAPRCSMSRRVAPCRTTPRCAALRRATLPRAALRRAA